MTTRLTKRECKALLEAACQMEIDYEIWCYETSDKISDKAKIKEAKRKDQDLKRGLLKLRLRIQAKKAPKD